MRFSPILVASVLVVGCSSSDSGKPIEVGHVHPIGLEDEEYQAIKLAVDELNKDTSKLPRGRRLLVRHAPGGSPEEFGAQAARLVGLNKVAGLVGGNRSASAERVGAASQGENVVGVSPDDWPGSPPSQNLFTIGLSPGERGRVLAAKAKELLAGKPGPVLILRDRSAKVANLVADRFVAELRDAVVTDMDLPLPRKIDAKVVFFACAARQVLPVRDDFRESVVIFGNEEAELPVLLAEGPAAEGFHVATAVDPGDKSERFTSFAGRYHQAYGRSPTAAAVLAHDALTVWVEAARRAENVEAKPVREELLK